MNILLWVLQILLALHTIMGAIWKFSNPEQTVASLKSIPHGAWLTLSIIELICALGLILPLFIKKLGVLAPVSALIIAAEMLLFCVLHFISGSTNYSQPIYWLVVAVVCIFIAYGRFVVKPL
jgi:uncharacterized membrane protein YphA (DoxX/SURF4 family)